MGGRSATTSAVAARFTRTGSAAQLAAMEHLIVFPVNGWWRLRAQHKKYNHRIRYALVVSLETVGTELDIFTPIEAAVVKSAVDVPLIV
jgi:hypothetical protein